MGSEKRQYPRIDLIFKVRYEEETSGKIESVAKDISLGGAAIQTQTALSSGQNIDLKLSFEELEGEIPVTGTVVRSWSEGDRHFAAISFLKIEESDRAIIDEYIHYFEEGIFNS